MKRDSPSATAILIAKSLVFVSGDERYRSVMPAGAGALSRSFLQAVVPAWRIAAIEALGRFPPARWIVSLVERLSVPGMIGHYILRKRRLEDIVQATADRYGGLQQLVIMGAGLDTLGTRAAASRHDLRVYEIDHPATSTAKRRAFAAGFVSLPSNLALLPIDLAAADPRTVLQSVEGFSFSATTLFIAEGVFMYLPLDGVGRALDVLLEFAPSRAAFAFTYMLPAEDGSRPAFRGQSPWVDRWLGLQREPFVWGSTPDELDAFVAQRGLSSIGHTDAAQLRHTYLKTSEQRRIKSAVGENIAWIER